MRASTKGKVMLQGKRILFGISELCCTRKVYCMSLKINKRTNGIRVLMILVKETETGEDVCLCLVTF